MVPVKPVEHHRSVDSVATRTAAVHTRADEWLMAPSVNILNASGSTNHVRAPTIVSSRVETIHHGAARNPNENSTSMVRAARRERTGFMLGRPRLHRGSGPPATGTSRRTSRPTPRATHDCPFPPRHH